MSVSLRGRSDLTLEQRIAAQSKTTDTGCVELTKAKTTHGYCQIRHNGKLVAAHRLALQLTGVVIPPGMVIDHTCSNRACINVGHLEVVTQAENCRRGRTGQAGSKPIDRPTALAIKQSLTEGKTFAECIQKYGVSIATVRKIDRGQHKQLTAVEE